MAQDVDAEARGDVPPLDLAGHFRELARAFFPALIVALVVGGAVFAYQSLFVPKQYSATIITEITPGAGVAPGDAYIEQLRGPFIGLAQDVNVLDQVLSEVDTGWDAETLKEHVRLTPGSSPQLLVFTATASSTELAERIVRSMVVTVTQAAFANTVRDVNRQVEQVQAAITAEEAHNGMLAPDDPNKAQSDKQLADLRAHLNMLQVDASSKLKVLSNLGVSRTPVAPRPVSQGIVAGLVALIVAAEAIVLLRSRVGSRPNKPWARRVARKYQAKVDPEIVAIGRLPRATAAILIDYQRHGCDVLVLSGNDAAFDRSDALLKNLDAGHQNSLIELELSSDWWRTVDIHQIAIAVVIVSMASKDRKVAEGGLRQLRELDRETRLVLQQARAQRGGAPPAEAAPAEAPQSPAQPSEETYAG